MSTALVHRIALLLLPSCAPSLEGFNPAGKTYLILSPY